MDFPAMIEDDYEGAVALAEEMLAALKLLRGDIEIVAAMAKMPLPDAAHLADEAIAKAEGRANG